MKRPNLVMLFAVLFAVSLAIAGQEKPDAKIPAEKGSLQPGIVVEAVEKNYNGDKAGLEKGDVLLRWVRGEAGGQIESPFTLFTLDEEQRPRGVVIFEGLRNGEARTWAVGSRYWGLTIRPNLPEDLLSAYEEGQKLSDSGNKIQAAVLWQSAAFSASRSLELSAWFYFRAAEMFHAAGELNEFDAAYKKAIEQTAASMPENVPELLFRLGNLSAELRNSESVIERYYQQALEGSQKWHYENLSASISSNLGLLEMGRSDLAKAEIYFRQAMEIYDKCVPDSLDAALGLLNMGMISIVRGNLAKGEEYEQRGLLIFRRLAPKANGVLVALDNLGDIMRRRGELARAREYFLEALKIKERSAPNAPIVATFLLNLGTVADLLGEEKEAEEYLQRALTLLKELSAKGPSREGPARGATIVDVLTHLGYVAQHQGDLAKAERVFKEALLAEQKTAPESQLAGEIFNALGDVSRKRGDLTAAEEYYRRALSIRERLEPGSRDHAETLADLAWTMHQTNRVDVAADFYEQALNAFESQIARMGGSDEVRSGFRAGYESYYKEYIDLLMAQSKYESAFNVMERSRARSLLEMLAANHVDVHKGIDSTLLDQERNLKERLKGKINKRIRSLEGKQTEEQKQTLDAEIASLLHQHEEIEGRIRTNSPIYAALIEPQPLDAKSVQRMLPNGTLLLEYSLGEKHSYVFAVTANSFNVYQLPSRAEIEREAERLYRALTERGQTVRMENERQRRARLAKADAVSRTTAVELSRMVLGPVIPELQQRKLVIVSDGALQYIPFSALFIWESQSAKIPAPLILSHEIVNLPSASVLASLHRREKNGLAQKEVAVFADPVFDRRDSRVKRPPMHLSALNDSDKQRKSGPATPMESNARTTDLTRSVTDLGQGREIHLPRLAFTRDEAKAIMAVVTPGMGMEALGFNASRNLAVSGELARYRVIHFATHALVDNIHPELSGLVLSLVDKKGEPMDGFLELQDIYNLDLSADLVVLSACQTALGKQINGEGMIGLTRGFMYAGSPHVLASLWKVDDFATAKLMAHFYKALERDRMTPAQALRKAQVELLTERPWSVPYYWAGFTLQGDWR